MAYGAMVGVEPSTTTRRGKVTRPMTASTHPPNTAPQKPTASSRAARSLLRLPSSRLMELPEPLPKKKPNAWNTVITE